MTCIVTWKWAKRQELSVFSKLKVIHEEIRDWGINRRAQTDFLWYRLLLWWGEERLLFTRGYVRIVGIVTNLCVKNHTLTDFRTYVFMVKKADCHSLSRVESPLPMTVWGRPGLVGRGRQGPHGRKINELIFFLLIILLTHHDRPWTPYFIIR